MPYCWITLIFTLSNNFINFRIDDVTWHGENIYVLKEITIYPPYRPENVKGNMDSKALKHVRKIVSYTHYKMTRNQNLFGPLEYSIS